MVPNIAPFCREDNNKALYLSIRKVLPSYKDFSVGLFSVVPFIS